MPKLCIVGLGAAGLGACTALAQAADRGFAVPGRDYELVVLEAGPSAGRKLLLSGGGRCNLTHTGTVEAFTEHYFENGKFLFPSLRCLSPQALIKLMEGLGVPCKEENGRFFPRSERAADVRDALLRGAASVLRGAVRYRTKVMELKPSYLLRSAEGARVAADRLLLAGGGCSLSETGSDGTLHRLLAALGVRLTDCVPGLVGLQCAHDLGELSGIGFEAEFTLRPAARRSKREAKEYRGRGDILITEDGFTGPSFLDLSRTLNGSSGILELRWPGLSALRAEEAPRGASLRRLLQERMGIPDRLLRALLRLHKAEHLRAPFDPAELRNKLQALGNLRYPVRPGPWRQARVTRGGVRLRDVNPETLELGNFPGLYVAGELLDIDGESGGYNLQAAFSTGYLAGRSMLASIL